MPWSWTLTWPVPSGEAERRQFAHLYNRVGHPTCVVAVSSEYVLSPHCPPGRLPGGGHPAPPTQTRTPGNSRTEGLGKH